MPDPRSIAQREPFGNSEQLPDALPPAIEAAIVAIGKAWVDVWPDDYASQRVGCSYPPPPTPERD